MTDLAETVYTEIIKYTHTHVVQNVAGHINSQGIVILHLCQFFLITNIFFTHTYSICKYVCTHIFAYVCMRVYVCIFVFAYMDG